MSYEEVFFYLILCAAGLIIFFITFLMISNPEPS